MLKATIEARGRERPRAFHSLGRNVKLSAGKWKADSAGPWDGQVWPAQPPPNRKRLRSHAKGTQPRAGSK